LSSAEGELIARLLIQDVQSRQLLVENLLSWCAGDQGAVLRFVSLIVEASYCAPVFAFRHKRDREGVSEEDAFVGEALLFVLLRRGAVVCLLLRSENVEVLADTGNLELGEVLFFGQSCRSRLEEEAPLLPEDGVVAAVLACGQVLHCLLDRNDVLKLFLGQTQPLGPLVNQVLLAQANLFEGSGQVLNFV